MVGAKTYIPERGDIVLINLNPQAGHEQAGKRPALVVSPAAYNLKSGLALLCPVTSRIKGYPFEIILPERISVSGVVLSDQVKSLDWKARKAEFICRAPEEVTQITLKKLNTLFSD